MFLKEKIAVKIIKVAAALIFNESGDFLLSTRPEDKAYASYWELAGGKLEKGESFEETLIRECEEELGIKIKNPKFFGKFFHSYPQTEVLLKIFRVEKENWSGEIQAKEKQKLAWVN